LTEIPPEVTILAAVMDEELVVLTNWVKPANLDVPDTISRAKEEVILPEPVALGAAKIDTVAATGIVAAVLITPPSNVLKVVPVAVLVFKIRARDLKLIPSVGV
jgi:hypothetical protein